MTNDKHGLCPKCREVKPLKEFKKLATPTQMRAWGKAGNVRMEMLSKYCKECRPTPRPLSKLSPAKIKERILSGEIIYKDPARAEQILANRIERGRAALVRSGKEHQFNKKRERWAQIVEEVSTTHKRFDLQLRNLLRKGIGVENDHHALGGNHALGGEQQADCRDFLYNPHTPRIAYTTACVDALKRIKLSLKPVPITKPPPSWQHLLTEEEIAIIQSLYNVLPKKGLYQAAVLNLRKSK